jgi:hypothetical protein
MRRIAQGFAEFGNHHPDGSVTHRRCGPHPLQQSLFGDDNTRMGHQITQHIKGFEGQGNNGGVPELLLLILYL